MSAADKPLKPNGEALIDTSLTPAAEVSAARPWTDWISWRQRCAVDPDAHKAWLAAAGGVVNGGVARLPEGLPDGKARDWLEATLASAGLRLAP